jgi:hypothetical protein
MLVGKSLLGLRRSAAVLVRSNGTRTFLCSRRAFVSAEEKTPPRRKKSIQEIQKQHLQAMEEFEKTNKVKLKTKEEELEHERKALRGSDGFLEFKEVDPPWTLREKGSGYNIKFFLDDANHILRKSKKADQILGGASILFIGGIGVGSYFNVFPTDVY